MRSLSSLLILLLACSFPLLSGCPADDDDDSAADDDDATGDDDDATGDDDDATGDDDDSAGPISCAGDLPIFDEGEVNDTIDGVLDITGEPTDGFCIEGTLTCGERDYLDLDHARFALAESREVTVTLAWTGNSDLDSYLWPGSSFAPEPQKGDEPLITWQEGATGSEVGSTTVEASTAYVTRVGCWEGQDTPYTLTVTYDTVAPGDDDDSAGDDDDSAGDDDDSAGDDDDSVGDDDDAAGDDDDSAGDDDDSAGDDDDSAGDDDDSAGDDDDSAVTCSDEVLGNSIDDDCDGEVDEYTFTDVYGLVISQQCGCHSGPSHSTGWFFNNSQATAYTNLVGATAFELSSMPRIDPSSSTNSYLMHKVDGTAGSVGGSNPSQMPLGGSQLSSAHLEGIRGWINSGAAND